ncbi:FimV/HubP family polar landmark protein [Vibrio aestuarianus]|uniref:FimV/HubP family polar landmark protein n=3 Tax=Vibrio aestuarianus TaxID=28171 RepID=UPI00249CABB7|nr:FimV/HubP family polar landmark protein [Vibrio aestuarianus]WDS54711.1 hypothetical protein MCL29_02580 [Vibrio aestuarianus]WDS58422.1 hypothetical protein MCL31_02505 [Vibrio aestuarianus]
MRQIIQRLLLPIAIVAVTQISIVSAESIRLIGPNGEIQSSPQFSENLAQTRNLQQSDNQPSKFFGPTLESDTLWSIATRLRPSNAVTVQQTLFAIYRLNPQAFENQNIHSLMPGSNLRIPSLAQIRSSSTQDAVNVMAAHQAKLDNIGSPSVVAAPPAPVTPVKPPVTNNAVAAVESPTVKPAVETPVTSPAIKTLETQIVSSDAELMALEEKNHKLRLMLADVKSEVDELKGELGDENRIRSEVEKLLDEERRKAAEAQKLAPSALDQLLSNPWLVAALAIIPGLLIGLIVVMLLGRRSKTEAQQEVTPPIQENIAPITVGDPNIEDIGDDLMLDDDLFGESDDSEKLFGDDIAFDDETDPNADKEPDIFADLEDSDLDFNLEGEDDEDPFASIGDDGDLEELTSSSNGISVSGDEKAVGLDEMARALDEASVDSADESEFDLSDADIEALLNGDGATEELESDTLDQSLLDDLLASTEQDDHDDFDFDSLLDDSGDDFNLDSEQSDPINTDFGIKDAELASDSELDDLFANIEAEADLEQLEASAIDDTALLDELLNEEESPQIDSNSIDLLDELLDEEEDESLPDLTQSTDLLDELVEADNNQQDTDEPDFSSAQTLDELLGDTSLEDEDVDLKLDEESTDLLDELLSDDDGSETLKIDETAILDELADNDDIAVEDGTELFEELLEIEQHAQQVEGTQETEVSSELTGGQPEIEEAEFNRNTFIDDMLNVAPDKDPLLDDGEIELSTAEDSRDFSEEVGSDDDFDFNPEIEGSDYLEQNNQQPSNDTPSLVDANNENVGAPEAVANEFGIPQDGDWELEQEPLSDANAELAEERSEPVAQETFEELDDESLPEFSEEEALASFEPEKVSEQESVEEDVLASLEAESVDAPIQEQDEALDELELPEYTEQDALADANAELAEESSEPVAQETFEALDDESLPEFSEEEALASFEPEKVSEQESVEEDVLASLEAESVDAPIQDQDEALDELELPEYTEQDALADANAELAEESSEPVAQETFEAIDDESLPEFSEEEALASFEPEKVSEQEPVEEDVLASLEAESVDAPIQDQDEALDELELPEYTEQDALADANAELAEESSEPVAQETFEAIDDESLPEFSEEEALASFEPEKVNEQEPVEEDAFASLEAESIDAPVQEQDEALDELELPEYTEQDALADANAEPAEESLEPVAQETFEAIDDESLPEFSEEEALASFEPEKVSEQEPVEDGALASLEAESVDTPVQAQENNNSHQEASSEQSQLIAKDEFDEQALNDWLNEDDSSQAPFSFEKPLDTLTIDSAGMNIDAMLEMGGEDWNGFNLTPDQQASIPDDVPEEEREVWNQDIQTEEPEILEENWAMQDVLDDFDAKKNQYMTIDELMAQVDDAEQGAISPEDEALKLDVGLNEFPDVIGDIGDVDVDSDSEASGKLDLAKIYIEMNDEKGAIKLLEEAIVDGNDDIRREAKTLIDIINGRV